MTKSTTEIVIAWVLIIAISVLVGGVVQMLLFKHDDVSILVAMRTRPYLWILYFGIGHYFGERILRGLARARS